MPTDVEPSPDIRWADMYARIHKYVVDIDDQPVEFMLIGFYVWWDGKYFWTEQNIDLDTFTLFHIDVFTWILGEMVDVMDEYIEGKRV